jgi:hypothetical protein
VTAVLPSTPRRIGYSSKCVKRRPTQCGSVKNRSSCGSKKERWSTSISLKGATDLPIRLPQVAQSRLYQLIDAESSRARIRLEEIAQRFPSAGQREQAQRFIEQKKQVASVLGGVTGVFGAVTVPVDLGGMAYLELSLLVEVATVFKANLRVDRGKDELLELFGYASGVAPVQRVGPKVVGGMAALLLAKRGMATLAKAMPLVAAPISAYFNNQHVQRVGDAAVRHYDGWERAHQKRAT